MRWNIALVSCVKEKRGFPSPAKDLYVSAWFKKASPFAACVADQWFILSAEYGLVRKGDVIAPYEKSLRSMSAEERKEWGGRVANALRGVLTEGDSVLLLAGKVYRDHVVPYLRERGCRVDVPMEHLRIGEQLAWLERQLVEIGPGHGSVKT